MSRDRAPRTPDLRGARAPLLIAALIAGIVLTTFAPVLRNEFVTWDDDLNLTANPAYRGLSWSHLRWMFTTFLAGHYQPLTWISLGLDYRAWGMDPTGYHLTNVLLHVGNTLLVFFLTRELLRAAGWRGSRLDWAAAIGALLFGIHPLRVEAVAWASERRQLLSACLLLGSVLAYVRAQRESVNRRRLYLLSLGLYAGSLLGDAWGMTLPFVLVVLDVYPLRRLTAGDHGWRPILIEKVPYAGLAIAAGLTAFVAQSTAEMQTLLQHGVLARLAQAAYGLLFYIVKMILPIRLSPLYILDRRFDPTAPLYVASLLGVIALVAAVAARARRLPWLAAAGLAYVAIVSPVLGIAQAGPQLVADRYTYLACVPWTALAAAAIMAAPPQWMRLGIGAVGLTMALLAILTCRQAAVWRDSQTLWQHVLALDPENYIAHTNLGQLNEARGALDAALDEYSRALDANPAASQAHFNRGNVRAARGDLSGAIADYSAAIAAAPRHGPAYYNRGALRQRLGDLNGAAADYTQAIAVSPVDWPRRSSIAQRLTELRAAGVGVSTYR